MMFKLWSTCLMFWASCTAVPPETEKLPPPGYAGPVCYKPPCTARMINIKMYVEDSLWDRMVREARGDPTELLGVQMDIIFTYVNRILQQLDNGGFKVDFARDVVKLNRSEIVLEDTYVDRINGNKTTKVDPTNIFSQTFQFQEAVQKLPDRNSTDLRILFITERRSDPTLAASEETCICNPDWFGCVAVFSIAFLDNWGHNANVFAHEIGHALGMDLHDNQFYTSNPKSRLLMWVPVGFFATIWSPEAKRRINNQDNSCLTKEILSSKEEEVEVEEVEEVDDIFS
eukprot:GFUD01109228.1.p1 GENE.GFUD01109228.1~~GFUD01109228.1.p1  ORF type:complete len:286 (-),score=77.15 GFUD01109228.1:363-1220(-)